MYYIVYDLDDSNFAVLNFEESLFNGWYESPTDYNTALRVTEGGMHSSYGRWLNAISFTSRLLGTTHNSPTMNDIRQICSRHAELFI